MKNKKMFIIETKNSGIIVIYATNKMKALEVFADKYFELFNGSFTITEPAFIIDEDGNYLFDDEE